MGGDASFWSASGSTLFDSEDSPDVAMVNLADDMESLFSRDYAGGDYPQSRPPQSEPWNNIEASGSLTRCPGEAHDRLPDIVSGQFKPDSAMQDSNEESIVCYGMVSGSIKYRCLFHWFEQCQLIVLTRTRFIPWILS